MLGGFSNYLLFGICLSAGGIELTTSLTRNKNIPNQTTKSSVLKTKLISSNSLKGVELIAQYIFRLGSERSECGGWEKNSEKLGIAIADICKEWVNEKWYQEAIKDENLIGTIIRVDEDKAEKALDSIGGLKAKGYLKPSKELEKKNSWTLFDFYSCSSEYDSEDDKKAIISCIKKQKDSL